MNKTLSPAGICGEIDIPGSKSHTIRALLIALFANGTSVLHNALDSQDTKACIELCQSLGASVTWDKTNAEHPVLIVDSKKLTEKTKINIDCHNSGTTLYLASAMTSVLGKRITFTGDEQLIKRPIEPLLKSLKDLGCKIEPHNALTAPFTIQGALKGGKTSIKCMTSQYLSGLLLSCPMAKEDTLIEVPLLHEKPYVEITEEWLKMQGIKFQRNDDMTLFRIKGGQNYKPFEATIGGDYSSASFFFCAAAMTGGSVTVNGLLENDAQGDKAILDVLQKMGCTVKTQQNSITVTGPTRLTAGEFDLNSIPDSLPALAVTSCFATGPVKLYNTPQARLKETDRIQVMVKNINALGGKAQELEDGLIVYPIDRFNTENLPFIDGYGDHRVVMAMALASLKCTRNLTIAGANAVDITFPNFFELFSKVLV